MDTRRWNKAMKEIEETGMLVDYLLYHGLDFDDPSNFTESMVKEAKRWKTREKRHTN